MMILEKIDRATGEAEKVQSTDTRFSAEIRRLAQLLNMPLADLQESLVCGNTFTTAGFAYTLIR